jgi:hypothetical protein
MALQDRAGVVRSLEVTGHQRVLERPDSGCLGLIGGELPERGRERGVPGLAVLPEPREEPVQLRERHITGAGERLVGLYEAGFDPANNRLVARHQRAELGLWHARRLAGAPDLAAEEMRRRRARR